MLKKTSLFVLGDSISIYYGPYLKAFLGQEFDYDRKREPGIRKSDLNKPVGGNGEDSGKVLEYLAGLKKAGRLKFDRILLNCGLHDIKTGPKTGKKQVPLAEYRRNLKKVFRLLKSSGVKIVWVRTTPVEDRIHKAHCKSFNRYNRDVEAYNKAADRLAKAAGIPFIDLNGFTKALGGKLYADHVHFTRPVSRLQAAYIAGKLNNW